MTYTNHFCYFTVRGIPAVGYMDSDGKFIVTRDDFKSLRDARLYSEKLNADVARIETARA